MRSSAYRERAFRYVSEDLSSKERVGDEQGSRKPSPYKERDATRGDRARSEKDEVEGALGSHRLCFGDDGR